MYEYMIELDCMTDLTDITRPTLGLGTGFGCLLLGDPRERYVGILNAEVEICEEPF